MFNNKKRIEESLTHFDLKPLTNESYSEEYNNLDYELETHKILLYFCESDQLGVHSVYSGLITQEKYNEKIEKYIRKNYKNYNNNELEKLIVSVKNSMWGYEILEDLINDDNITDIKIIKYNNIRIKRKGKRETSCNISFSSQSKAEAFINRVCIKNGVSLNASCAEPTFMDIESNSKFRLRFTATSRVLTPDNNSVLCIRKIAKSKVGMDGLVEAGMFNEDIKKYLITQINDSSGILIIGKGSSGKTTLMNNAIEEISHNKAITCVQENDECFTDTHPEIIFKHIMTNTGGENKIQHDLSELVRTSLLTDNDYILLGEIKGTEARYFFNASFTGYQSWATIHGVSAEDGIDKLADYIMQSEARYNKDELMKMLRTIKTLIFLKDFKVMEIAECIGWDEVNKKLIYKKIVQGGELCTNI